MKTDTVLGDNALTVAGGQPCEVHINIDEIPDFRRESLAQGALDLVALAFAQPDAESRFQAWLAERRRRGVAS